MKDDGSGELKWKSMLMEGLFEKVVRLISNIFRKEWPIISDPEQALLEDDKITFPVAWEDEVIAHIFQSPGRPPACKSALFFFSFPNSCARTATFGADL